MNMKKIVAVASALSLTAAVAVGGTLAWLADDTAAITNTFTVGGIEISLVETKAPDGTTLEGNWEAALVPSMEYDKDPVVSVTKNDVETYLFVKFEETNSPSTYLTYTSNLSTTNGWTKLTGVDGVDNVWYRTVEANAQDAAWHLLDGDKVTVKNEVGSTEVPMPGDGEEPSLTYTAYAIQTDGFEGNAAAAWNALQEQIA